MKTKTSASADPLVTRDGIRVAVGQVWEDQDPRASVKRRRILSVDPVKGKVTWDSKPRTSVSVRRMYRHSTGFVLVSE